MSTEKEVMIITCDAGGTMTDTFLVDKAGNFSTGKAAATPDDESIGYWESLEDAFSYIGGDLKKQGKELLSPAQACIYAGTSMLNSVLQRKGRQVGVLVTRGFESAFVLERGMQTYGDMSYPDRMHAVCHYPNPPLVPRNLTVGVTERIDLFGRPIIPLYEHEVAPAVELLLKRGAEVIVIVFLQSFMNPIHEQTAAKIARETIIKTGKDIEVLISSEVAPIVREFSRLNCLAVQAASSEVVRTSLYKIETKLRDSGYKHTLNILLGYGGLCNVRYPRLYEGMVSGPVGGVLGVQTIAKILGVSNAIGTDMGGTSFDLSLITAGSIPLTREPMFARLTFNMPMVQVNSIGAGTGSFIRLDPLTKRVLIGPDSAGANPGPVCYDTGNETPTICDADLILGILNEDYYLGGKIKLNKEKAFRNFKTQIADPLGLDVYEAAEGMINLINASMSNAIRQMVLSQGYTPADYILMSFGGAGPMHLAGYAENLGVARTMTTAFAAVFSAFGAATVDIVHRFHKSTFFMIPPGPDGDAKMSAGNGMNAAWEELENTAYKMAAEEGYRAEQVKLEQIAFVRYGGQLDDVEIVSPNSRLKKPEHVDALTTKFNDTYGQIYGLGARFPQGGYQILEVAVRSTVPKVKPVIPKLDLKSREVSDEARKGTRSVYYQGSWHKASLYEVSRLEPGNEIKGIAVLEAPDTTVFIPPGKRIRLDNWRFMWLEEA